jgi:hypothetical protein
MPTKKQRRRKPNKNKQKSRSLKQKSRSLKQMSMYPEPMYPKPIHMYPEPTLNANMYIEKSSYAEKNGQVIEDKYVNEIIQNDKAIISGYDNGNKFYITKQLHNGGYVKHK